MFGVHYFKGEFCRNNVPVSRREKEQIYTSIIIGYNGHEYHLRKWASKQTRLKISYLPSLSVEEVRQGLWKAVQGEFDNLPSPQTEEETIKWNNCSNFHSFVNSEVESALKVEEDINIFYLSNYDKRRAQLVEKFINWYANR